jgi:flagellar biosynthetic protein FlhB
MVLRLALAIAGALLLLGVGDYLFQLWRHEQLLRMSRQQLKEETKREEGDPQTKARIRRLQREAARKKMFHEVKSATVVVTNPTHLAVALRYDRGAMGAPKVVAKGAGHVAKRIAELARRHNVPVLERKTLAQALFRTVKLNQEIPMAIYHAVAEVLATVYRGRGQILAQQPPESGK